MKRYTESHEWIELEGPIGTIGVTAYAKQELGDIVYVELPYVGKKVFKGGEAAVLESTKAASDVYSPVSGTILEVNDQLSTEVQKINDSPEKEGWLFKVQLDNLEEVASLMTWEEYQKSLG
ncbi:glycine cleavage system protein GcvH [Parachlamydia sp. AcF125]|uniref:glycine cleavage system protein GcvH n=1 Tax=Parachlamydia sp. AcF125 TaxID=2795736 RepID=UPI001BC94E80|nr:glycine cleavage system protein GcvH [Parachlamydia sp. AcF125]MBS4167928.1 Glycine cleavage system H protein [Parachlamydia sp. AcF125]